MFVFVLVLSLAQSQAMEAGKSVDQAAPLGESFDQVVGESLIRKHGLNDSKVVLIVRFASFFV